MSAPHDELRRLIQAYMDPQHKEHALKLLDAIMSGGSGVQIGAGALPVVRKDAAHRS
jgi:hypothetical protein